VEEGDDGFPPPWKDGWGLRSVEREEDLGRRIDTVMFSIFRETVFVFLCAFIN
jgi:hypothetical protein